MAPPVGKVSVSKAERATRRYRLTTKSRGQSSASPGIASPDDIFAQRGLTRVINVSGTETVKGAAPVCPEVLAAVAALAPHSVDMLELQSLASRTIARLLDAEAGLVTHCTAAGISMAVAATMTGANAARVRQLPTTRGMKNEVILQRGHHIDYGGDLGQNIRLTGAKVKRIGTPTHCDRLQLEAAFSARTTAAIYVVSHHTADHGMIPLSEFCSVCRKARIPVIVDAAAEDDPRLFLRAGADLVLVSLHKQFASLTGAILAGGRQLIRACLYQETGIARPMKAGKETVIAGIVALERWAHLDQRHAAQALATRLEKARTQLAGLQGLTATIVTDITSGRFARLHLRIEPHNTGPTAPQVADALAALTPSIYVRRSSTDARVLQLDFRRTTETSLAQVVASIQKVMASPRKTRVGPGSSFAGRRASFPLLK